MTWAIPLSSLGTNQASFGSQSHVQLGLRDIDADKQGSRCHGNLALMARPCMMPACGPMQLFGLSRLKA